LVLGEAGIGKTSLVHAFLSTVGTSARVLLGAGEDLLSPRALGPLRDAVRFTNGPLAEALSTPENPDLVYSAICEELGAPPTPTILVVEDVHWADGATLDAVRYLGRRVENLPGLLVLTFRDDDLGRDHPLRGVVAGFAGRAIRLSLRPLSAEAVGRLAASSTVDASDLMELTGGNPFFVTEALACSEVTVPASIVDAVLARVRSLGPGAQNAIEQLAVVPSGAEIGMLRTMLGDLSPLADAERAGVLVVREGAVAFHHELARRAVAESLPASIRLELNARVLEVLLANYGGDPFRVLHHAVEAADDPVVVEYGMKAGREASHLGAHRQAASCFAQVLARVALVPPERRASLGEAYAWALSNCNQLHAAVEVAAMAVEAWEQVGADDRLVRALVTLSRQQWLTEQPVAALASAERALGLAEASSQRNQALALLNIGGLLVLLDREEEGITHLDRSVVLAEDVGAKNIACLSRGYLGSAHLQLGDLAGEDELLYSAQFAREIANHEYVMRAYYNLVEGMWRLGRFDQASGYIDQAVEYSADRDFPVHSYMLIARKSRLSARRGGWKDAEDGLWSLLDGQDDPGQIGRETVPILARLLVRRGDPRADDLLELADQHATRADNIEWLVPTGLAHIERAWLQGAPELAGRYPKLLLERTDRPGTDVMRGELLRYLRRLGSAVQVFDGCPGEYAAGIRGDWRTAAAAWQRIGDPYELALELADSGEVEPTLEALTLLDRLGAEPAAALVRARLRQLGVARMPRRQHPATLANPGGLTRRQMEILRLLATGLSNLEIAQRLVISPRTVDHHVAAVLQKLDAHSRREAVARLTSFDSPH
jgi:DNA-binding CsgD family transcriptional regulator/tetratricopeptide (TPR) repeat protein